jgi:hypothetical protein
MLFYLTCWVLLTTSGAAIGNAILALTKSSGFPHSGDRLITAIWLGLLTIATMLLGLSTIVPLSPAIGFILIAILTAGAVSTSAARRDLRNSLQFLTKPVALTLGLIAVVVAWDAAGLVEAFDTGFYHYQLTRWLSEYGTVPGLALFENKLGLSSSWFALAAPFDFGPFQGRISGLLGGLAIFLSLVHFALAVSRILERRANRADWFLVGGYALVFPVCFTWAFEVSLSPDVPVWVLTILTAWLMLVTNGPGLDGDHGPRLTPNPILPLILAAGATTIKFSAVPVMIVAALFYWFNSAAKWSTRLVLGSIASLIALPMFIVNTVSSGYPLFPSPLLRLDLPWGIERADAQEFAAGITSWARWGGLAPAGATARNWILPWFLHWDKLLLISFCGICLLGFVAVRGWRGEKSFLYILGLSLLGTAFVFTNAPNPRFGLGYLALCPALFLGAIGPHFRDLVGRRIVHPRASKRPTTLAYLLVSVALLVVAQSGLRERGLLREIRVSNLRMPANAGLLSHFLLPPSLPKSPGDLVIVKNRQFDSVVGLELTMERSNGIEYRRPLKGDQCWGAALPCASTSFAGDVHLRDSGNGIRSGFTRSQGTVLTR